VNVNVSVAERFARCKVEVTNHLVDTNATLNSASFLTLRIEFLRIVFAHALLDVFATAKRPGDGGVGLTDFLAGVTAAVLDSGLWRWSAVTLSTVIRIQMLGIIFMSEMLSVTVFRRSLS